MVKEREIYLSLVIPLYNEERRIEVGLIHALNFLKRQNYLWEIVLVDDGSTDRSYALAQKLLESAHHQLLRHGVNRGKGAAIKNGVLSARGKYIMFSDIDFSTPISELPKLLTSLKTHDVAIGTRRLTQSKVTKHQPILRERLGHVFTKLTNFFVVPHISDVTCGFKGYRREAARKLFQLARIERWAFDAEVLFLARKFGFNLAQIPVVWADNEKTKVNMLRDGVKAFIDLLKIRLYDLSGSYDQTG